MSALQLRGAHGRLLKTPIRAGRRPQKLHRPVLSSITEQFEDVCNTRITLQYHWISVVEVGSAIEYYSTDINLQNTEYYHPAILISSSSSDVIVPEIVIVTGRQHGVS